MNKRQKAEVNWYRRNGKYQERIRLAGSPEAYVVGDWSWNLLCKDRPEIIEPLMNRDLGNGKKP